MRCEIERDRLLFVVVMLCMIQYTQAMEAHMPKDWHKLPDMGKWDGVPSADFRTGWCRRLMVSLSSVPILQGYGVAVK